MRPKNRLHLDIGTKSQRTVPLISTARRHASAVYPVVICLPICPSVFYVTSRCCIEMTVRIEQFVGMEASFHLPARCYTEINSKKYNKYNLT